MKWKGLGGRAKRALSCSGRRGREGDVEPSRVDRLATASHGQADIIMGLANVTVPNNDLVKIEYAHVAERGWKGGMTAEKKRRAWCHTLLQVCFKTVQDYSTITVYRDDNLGDECLSEDRMKGINSG